MHPQHFWWLAAFYTPQKMYGSMTAEEVRAIYIDTYGSEDLEEGF